MNRQSKKDKDELSLINKFIKYNKFREFIDLEESEVKISIVLTIFFILVCSYILDIYGNFSKFEPALQNISIYISTAMIGVIGIILAGISIIVGTLNKENMKLIEHLNGKGTIEEILISFEFIAFISAIQVVMFFAIYLVLHSNKYLLNKTLFYIIMAIIIYIFIFSLFYIVSLIGNTIYFFIDTKKYDEAIEEDYSIIAQANQIRIDFILNTILSSNKIDKETFKNLLLEYNEKTNNSKKNEIEEYFKKYYKF